MSAKSDGFTFVADIFHFVTDLINNSITENVAAITPLLGGLMYAAFFLYAVYLSYNWYMSGNVQLVKDGLGNFVLLGIITSIALKGTYYTTNITPIILSLGDELGGVIAGVGNTGNGGEVLDKFITTVYKTILSIWKDAYFSMTGESNIFESVFIIVLLVVGAVPFVVTTFGILLTAKFMVALLLSVGTIFICCAFFPQTRQWFSQWVGMCFNYILIATLFPIALTIEMKAIDMFILGDGKLGVDMTTAFKMLVILGAFLAISIQIPVLASSLSGGVGINGMSGSFSSMMGGIKSLTNPILGAGKGAGKLGMKGYKAYQKRRENRGNNIKAG
jgi:type IV secretion system protein VirB6